MGTFGKLKKTSRRGRPAQCQVTPEDRAKLRSMYLKTNRTGDSGSHILAARMLAINGELSADVTEAILKQRHGNALPKCIADAMHTPKALVQRQRDKKNAILRSIYVPGNLRMVRDVETGDLRRLNPGERQSWDDATINIGVCVPWPWGGDKCADKYGVKLGRFQFLTCVDDATDYCPGFDYVIRDEQSYRAEDVISAQYRMGRNTYVPERYMLEGGSWQCNRAKEFHAAAGIEVEDATGRPNNKLVEGFFNRLWTVISPTCGHVGRFRGEQRAESDIYIACRQGRKDPRQYFASLNDALNVFSSGIHYLNTTRMHSRRYGSWVPEEMHNTYLADHPRPQMTEELFFHAAPVVEQRKVRRGMVQVSCISPFGESFPYHFAEERLWEYEGRDVKIYFDPWDSDLEATIVLVSEYRGTPAGTVLCRAACIEDAPQVRRHADSIAVEITTDGHRKALDMRKRVHSAIRREHRAIHKAADAAAPAFASETRSPNMLATIQSIQLGETDPTCKAAEAILAGEATNPLPKAARKEDWRKDMDARLEEAERYEAEARRRGELLPV